MSIPEDLSGRARTKVRGRFQKKSSRTTRYHSLPRDVEFTEETGFIADSPSVELGSVRQKSGKSVLAWACAGGCDPATLVSNICEIEWPRLSKRRLVVAEVDRGAWFDIIDALRPLSAEQHPFLTRLEEYLRKQ